MRRIQIERERRKKEYAKEKIYKWVETNVQRSGAKRFVRFRSGDDDYSNRTNRNSPTPPERNFARQPLHHVAALLSSLSISLTSWGQI